MANGIVHSIIFLRGDRVLRIIAWNLGVETAKAYARDHMAIRKADRIEIRDEAGQTVFEWR